MAAFDCDHHRFDVVSAYLLCDPKDTSFARFPSGFREYLVAISDDGKPNFEPDEYLRRVRKNVYCGAAAGAIWYEHILTYLMRDLLFARSTIDCCLFVRAFMRDGRRVVCLVLLYNADVLFVGDFEFSKEMSDAFCSYYKTTAGGDDYLGLEISHDKLTGCVRVTQTAFIKKLVSRFGLEKCAHALTPLPSG